MMKILLITTFIILNLSVFLSAQITKTDLIGKWTFVYWMEQGDESSKRDINILMEFKDDGSIVTYKGNKTEEANYKIEGEKIIYSDKRGSQVWEIISFEPGSSFLVNHKGANMYFQK